MTKKTKQIVNQLSSSQRDAVAEMLVASHTEKTSVSAQAEKQGTSDLIPSGLMSKLDGLSYLEKCDAMIEIIDRDRKMQLLSFDE